MWSGSCLVVTSPLRLEYLETREEVSRPPLRMMVVGLTWERRRQRRRGLATHRKQMDREEVRERKRQYYRILLV